MGAKPAQAEGECLIVHRLDTLAHLLSLYSDLSDSLDHSPNAFVLAQGLPENRVAFDNFSTFSFLGRKVAFQTSPRVYTELLNFLSKSWSINTQQPSPTSKSFHHHNLDLGLRFLRVMRTAHGPLWILWHPRIIWPPVSTSWPLSRCTLLCAISSLSSRLQLLTVAPHSGWRRTCSKAPSC